jgi:two-component system, cell cycle sensor histidine kinase DivJ
VVQRTGHSTGVSERRPTTSLIDARLAGLVHASAQDDPALRARHERFLVSRLAVGAVTLAALPAYLVWRGVPSAVEAAAVVCLVLPVVAAVLLARTGRLGLAHALSATALAGLIACLAVASGGADSPALVWLAVVPLEALLSGSRRAATAASLSAVAAALAVVGVDLAAPGFAGTLAAWPSFVAMPVFAATAIGHATALAVEHVRREADWREAMRARDARDRSLLTAIDDLVTWHDRNGALLEASGSAARLIGASPDDLRGRGLLARVHVPDRPAFLKAISDAALGTAPVVAQFRLHVADAAQEGGRVIWAEMRAHRADEGGRAAVVAVTRDVSEHRRRADALEEARAEAQRADETKSRFLATVSHELRTPLNAIIGFSEILATEGALGASPERRQEYAGIIRDSGQHLLGVVNTLLDMSRIQSGQFEFAPEVLDPAGLVHGCCDLMRLRAEQAGVALVREIAVDLPEVVADARACRQMLINLLSNAVKFTGRGGRVVVAAARMQDRLVVSVSDTGIGIAESDLPRLGDPFFQAGAAYSRPHEGTGLGLSVVRGLVGLHDGELSVDSAPGEGTTVTIALPLGGARRSGAVASIRTRVRPGAAPEPVRLAG